MMTLYRRMCLHVKCTSFSERGINQLEKFCVCCSIHYNVRVAFKEQKSIKVLNKLKGNI